MACNACTSLTDLPFAVVFLLLFLLTLVRLKPCREPGIGCQVPQLGLFLLFSNARASTETQTLILLGFLGLFNSRTFCKPGIFVCKTKTEAY